MNPMWEETMIGSMISETFYASDKIKNGRTLNDIFVHLSEEHGELATEIMIANGNSYKESSADGVVGEAVDAIICLLDIIHVYAPEVTENDLNAIAMAKLAKWKDKA